MLAEDAGMIISRSGSWEGSNMATVLSSHGYQLQFAAILVERSRRLNLPSLIK